MYRKLFYLGNFLLLALFAAAFALDYNREWKNHQRGYYKKEVQRLQSLLAEQKDPEVQKDVKEQLREWKRKPLQIKQFIVKDLDRVDRCITCHVGMDPFTNPSQVNGHKENPYKSHPGDLHKSHTFQKFGCTSCHAGQGLATSVEDAHGDVHHWEKPMLKPPYLQASCAKCHADFEKLPGAQTVALGKKLFDKNGCIGCHSIRGTGGIISVDLGDIADKPLERIDFAHTGFSKEKHEWTVQNWIEAHLTQDPMVIVPNDPYAKYNAEPIAPSGMPPYYLELKKEEAQAVATYLLSLTEERIPRQYYVYASPKPEPKFSDPVAHGKYVFEKYGCNACHGQEGLAGRRNFNALGPDQSDPQKDMDKGREPTLPDTVGTFTREELRKKIEDGVAVSQIQKFNPEGPVPPLYMPAWKDKIKGREMEDLITYLLSIAKKTEEW